MSKGLKPARGQGARPNGATVDPRPRRRGYRMTAPIGAKCLEGLADMALQGQQHQLDRPRTGRPVRADSGHSGTEQASPVRRRIYFRHISIQEC